MHTSSSFPRVQYIAVDVSECCATGGITENCTIMSCYIRVIVMYKQSLQNVNALIVIVLTFIVADMFFVFAFISVHIIIVVVVVCFIFIKVSVVHFILEFLLTKKVGKF